MDTSIALKQILEEVKSQVLPHNFKAWFSPVQVDLIENNRLVIKVPSSFFKEQLLQRYESIILDCASRVLNNQILLEFITDSSLSKKKSLQSESEDDFFQLPHPPAGGPQKAQTILNPKYTLENFVVGFTNNLAYAAAQAVVENPGSAYNPLYIYGPSGVGKTHLMQGIANELISKKADTRVVFVSSEKFMNDFVESIKSKGMEVLRHKYRSCDILLVDDIQFISGKEGFQEEFFHTFNDLHSRNSQLVFTSDRPPNEIEKLEVRLSSRFAGGLMVDMQLPDIDTRIAILKTKLAEKGEHLAEDILLLIAQNVQSNTRELEGKLTQLLQRRKLTGQPLTEEIVRKVLGDSPVINSKSLNPDQILDIVYKYFSINKTDLLGPRRQKELVLPRQISMFLIHQECKLPFEKIGQILGGRDHTTIMHGVGKIKLAINRDREIQRMVMEVKSQLGG
jgi:chromosomal replication initiator protein